MFEYDFIYWDREIHSTRIWIKFDNNCTSTTGAPHVDIFNTFVLISYIYIPNKQQISNSNLLTYSHLSSTIYDFQIHRKSSTIRSQYLTVLSFQSILDMGIRLPSLLFSAKQILKTQSVSVRGQSNVPKGHIAVYVGEIQRKRFLVPISYLNHPSFVNLLSRAEEEFGFNHPTGGLTIPCNEEAFIDVTSRLYTS